MQKKLVVLFVFVLLAFAGLSARLIWINRENGERYKKQVLSQRKYDSLTLPYRRGDIVDAKGTKLAVSEKVYNLVVDAKVMLSKETYLEPTLKALGENFELDMTEVREYVTAHPESSWKVFLKQLTYDQISDFQTAALENDLIKGVWFEEEYRRIYPYGSLACDVIGFTGKDNTGTYGLEEFYNDMLNGTTGREYGYLNEDSELERTVKPAVDGNTIHLSLDANIQGIVEKYLKQFDDEHKGAVRPGNGANNVGCVVMEVDTGRVLAMASYPTFDLNNPKDLSAYYTEEEIAAMEENETLYDTLNQLWRNYCISDSYEPGSTSKPFTVAAALETGSITGNEVYECNGFYHVGVHDVKCHNVYGDGEVSVQNSIAWSCNVALMKIGLATGAENFTKFQKIFNFGLKTNIDLSGEARTASFLYKADEMKPIDLATNAFGQNFNTTMIQMITGFCSLINGGYYYEPHMVDKITNSSGATVKNIEPRVLKQTISESTSEKIRQYCRAVVMEEGGDRRTGKTARPAGYAIGGKTGTAQTLPRGNKEYVVSFIGYAPADDPRIAIYVVVDRANAEKQDDAKYATGIVRNVLSETLPYMNIFMTEELSEKEIQELEEKQLEITNMYTKKPEDDALNNGAENGEGSGGETGAEGNGGSAANGGAEGSGGAEGGSEGGTEGSGGESGAAPGQPVWMGFAVDPDTGYRVDPVTGEFLDPNTGDPVNKSGEPLDGNVPVNDKLLNPPQEEE